MKQELIIGIFITLALAVGGLFFLQNYKLQQAKFAVYASTNSVPPQNTIIDNGISQTSTTSTVAINTVATKVLSVQEVANHNSASDCYLIINSKVYNATSYLNLHPGGRGQIIPYCGQDATQAFATKGGQGSHSNSAFAELAQLYVGDIGAPIQTALSPTLLTVKQVKGTTSNSVNNQKNIASVSTPTGVFLSVQEVAVHNTSADCWLIISNKVYNATSYLNLHPGGRGQIIPYCGQDATQAFATKGGNGSHSGAANADLAQLYIGDIGSVAQATTIQNSSSSQVAPKSFSSGDDGDNEYEYEDD
jgi:cytochrome b involved in lipid metabolism